MADITNKNIDVPGVSVQLATCQVIHRADGHITPADDHIISLQAPGRRLTRRLYRQDQRTVMTRRAVD